MSHAAPDARPTDEIRVSDLDFAAALLLEGARLLGIADTPEPGRREFVLELPRRVAQGLAQAFVLGELRVEPRAYAMARRVLQRSLRTLDG